MRSVIFMVSIMISVASFVVAPGIQNLARYVAYGASAFSLLAMLILTVHI
jgi:hypothetical protein